MSRRGYAVVLALVLSAACGGSPGMGMGAGGPANPHTMAPAPAVPQLDSVPFRARSVYRRMGLLVDSTRMPFVASLRFLASRAPDSTIVIFGLSFANRVLNFRRDAAEFVAAYHIELVLRRDSTFTRTISRDATVRVATAPETMRRDESVIFQQLLTMPPGTYNVMAVVRDLNSPAYARVDIVDTVPLFAATSLSAPLPLYDGAGRKGIDSLPKVVVNPRGMQKYGTDTLHFYVEGYGLPAGTRLAARVLDADSVLLWADTVSLSAGAGTGVVLAAETAAGAEGKGMKQGRAARPGAESGAAAAAGVRAMFGAGSGADSAIVRSGAGAAAGAAAGANARGMFGGAASADADTSVRVAGAGVLGAGAAAAAAGDVATAGGAGAEVGGAARSGIHGLLGGVADSAAAPDSAKVHAGVADSASLASAPPAGGGGALSAMGIGAGAGALVGAGAVSASGAGGLGVAADADIGMRARGAGPRGRGPELIPLMTAEFSIPPARLPLGLQTLTVEAVGKAVRAEAPFLVGFSDAWTVRTFPQMIGLLRFYSRPDLVAKLKAAPRAERARSWRLFLQASDPTPQGTQHDSLDAYFQRIDLANRRFLEPAGPGWRTDRGEVYVNLGEPDQSYEVPGRKAPGVRWEFTSLKLTLSFSDPEGTGQYYLTQQSRIDYERALAQVRNAH